MRPSWLSTCHQSRALPWVAALCTVCAPFASTGAAARDPSSSVARFALDPPALTLARATTPGAFLDVVGRRAAAFGYEGRPLEAWIYPLKVLDRFDLAFELEGYPLPVPAWDLPSSIEVRPDATILTFSHAAFTVRQVLFAPIDEPAIVVLLDVDTTLPMRIIGRFRPVLRLMWPAGSPTANAGWDAGEQLYELTEDTGRFSAAVAVPGARDRSVMPYQEEPRDAPLEFVLEVTPEDARQRYLPIVIAGSTDEQVRAREVATGLLPRLEAAHRSTARHYRNLLDRSVGVSTPDATLDRAFAWAIVGMDKGFATNPQLGTGLVAGFRTSGNSERPGFAWYFGRDALWTTFALLASGAHEAARTALQFLEKYQREDGKIPHEISQSASFTRWFEDYPYGWASADATPLYVIAHAEHWRATGDRGFLDASWASLRRAYAFSAATDKDGNRLLDNTSVGHGWVEGGALYPPHEEIYMQGLWVEASRRMAELSEQLGDARLASEARGHAERTREAMERTYWLPNLGHYAFGTAIPRETPPVAEPGPRRERRQRALDALAPARLVAEDTVLPAVPLWWGTLDPERADAQIDRLGSGALATDWGHRLISARSDLYDPLSYHYGSVWPLFTGWASVGAYQYGRAHVGLQALRANAFLTSSGALGYVTELLSGDFNAPFGRSSHHQIWSEAMVVTPLLQGLMGIEAIGPGILRVAPRLPADWSRVEVRRIRSGAERLDLAIERGRGILTLDITRAPDEDASGRRLSRVVVAPALPRDARAGAVRVNGRDVRPTIRPIGDVQLVEIAIDQPPARTRVEIRFEGGTDVYLRPETPVTGARSEGLRVIRSRADARALRLVVEGLAGREYEIFLRTPRTVERVEGATLHPRLDGDPAIRVRFEGEPHEYVRREVTVGLK